MDLVKWAGFGVLGLAGLALAIFILDGFWPMFLGAAVSLAISGILLLASTRPCNFYRTFGMLCRHMACRPRPR